MKKTRKEKEEMATYSKEFKAEALCSEFAEMEIDRNGDISGRPRVVD